ncbi:unnamed protein product [Heligmosomoides polygyrus]|uniref:NARG2_C domain-containing protein n=1 Tax=Heligmosomoides polygyrus TaxID=6339 RepID=A0A183FMW4_HELPZ|nr:unnamed protein product [Heligmosomoides polygyrus]
MRIWPYNDLRWPADEQVSALSFPDKSGTNSPTPEGWKAWLAWAGNPNQEPGIGCTRQSRLLRLRYTRPLNCSIEWTSQVPPSSGDYFPIHVATVLKGRHDRIQLPNLRYRCRLEQSKLLCLENDVRIAMDATTACHLMTDSFTGHNYSYAMPVRVVEKMIQGTITNVVVVGKPRVLGAVDPSVIQRLFIKYMLKAAYILKRREARREASEPSHNESGEAARSKGDFCDPLDAILPALSSSSLQDGTNHSASGRTYSIFSITGKNILVRSRPAPLCSEGHQSLKGTTLSFQPKVEYVPNAGAMRLQEAEALWNYCKGIFKQSANHALFRTHYMGNNQLQIHFATMSVVQQQDAKRILSASTTRFSRLLEEIGHLAYGDYMLVNKHDGFVKVLPRREDDKESRDVLDCEKQNVLVAKPSVRICDAFEGLEPVVPLQWQVVQSRAPGCFVAPDSKLKLIASTAFTDSLRYRPYASSRLPPECCKHSSFIRFDRSSSMLLVRNVVHSLPEPSLTCELAAYVWT